MNAPVTSGTGTALPVAVAVLCAMLSTIVIGTAGQPKRADAYAHPVPLIANTIHPMSAGYSQPSAPGSRCIVILPWNVSSGGSWVNQWPCSAPYSVGTPSYAHWTMQMSSTFYGAFNIINDATGQCLDVTASSMAQGAQVIGYQCTGNANQAFQKADMGNWTAAGFRGLGGDFPVECFSYFSRWPVAVRRVETLTIVPHFDIISNSFSCMIS